MSVIIYDQNIEMNVYVEIIGVFRTLSNMEDRVFCVSQKGLS